MSIQAITPEQILAVNVDAIIGDVRPATCESFTRVLESILSSMNRDDAATAVVHFLYELTGLRSNFEHPTQPFRPAIVTANRRSLILSDLTNQDAEIIRALAERTQHAALRARLYDVVWEVARDHIACKMASEYYLKAASECSTEADEPWDHVVNWYRRGLALARRLGRKKEHYMNAHQAFEAATLAAVGTGDGRGCRFLRLLLELGPVNAVPFIEAAKAQGIRARQGDDLYLSRAYIELARDLARASLPEMQACSALLGETYVHEAQTTAANNHTRSSLLMRAIEEYRKAGDRERVRTLRKQLADVQYLSTLEMADIVQSIDWTDVAEKMEAYVQGAPFPMAMLRLALDVPLADLDSIERDLHKEAEEYVLLHSFGRTVIDKDGRVERIAPALLSSDDDQRREALKQGMFSAAAKSKWPSRCVAMILPMQCKIRNEHNPNLNDLTPLTRGNLLIPPGHEGLILPGLLAGFHGDFLTAVHLLVPQFESSIRFLLNSFGIDTVNLMEDGTQPHKTLGALLAMEETRSLLQEALCFELEGCLTEKAGYNFRNLLAHGFLNTAASQSTTSATVWWLALRFYATGLLMRDRHGGEGPPDEAGESDDPAVGNEVPPESSDSGETPPDTAG